MPEKLQRNEWANAVKAERSARARRTTFRDAVGQRRKSQIPIRSGDTWKKRVVASRTAPGGGRSRGLAKPSPGRRARKTGGMLRHSIPRKRKEITEAQRKALPKTGSRVPKRGLNASSWAYDHRKMVSERRRKTITRQTAGGKKGINASKWHYDHAKAKSQGASGRTGPTTHVSGEKRKTQRDAIAKHQPKQPTRPERPRAKPKARPPAPVRRK